jgi:hypothetical protein
VLQLHELELQTRQLALLELPLQLGRSDVDVLHVDRSVSILLHGAPLRVGVAWDLFPAPPLAMQDTMEARPPSVNYSRVIELSERRRSRGEPAMP